MEPTGRAIKAASRRQWHHRDGPQKAAIKLRSRPAAAPADGPNRSRASKAAGQTGSGQSPAWANRKGLKLGWSRPAVVSLRRAKLAAASPQLPDGSVIKAAVPNGYALVTCAVVWPPPAFLGGSPIGFSHLGGKSATNSARKSDCQVALGGLDCGGLHNADLTPLNSLP